MGWEDQNDLDLIVTALSKPLENTNFYFFPF